MPESRKYSLSRLDKAEANRESSGHPAGWQSAAP